jgi:hypothetical protein
MIGSFCTSWDTFVKEFTSLQFRPLKQDRQPKDDSCRNGQLMTAQTTIKRLYDLRKHLRSSPGGEEILKLLHTNADAQASDDRDGVYGLLGLATERDRLGIPVDYSKCRAEVFRDATIHIIRSKRSLDVLASDWPRQCGVPYDEEPMSLPSWVPVFSRSLLKHGLSPLRSRKFHASAGREPNIKNSNNVFKLVLQEVTIGTIVDATCDWFEHDELHRTFGDLFDTFRLVILPTLAHQLSTCTWQTHRTNRDAEDSTSTSRVLQLIHRLLTLDDADDDPFHIEILENLRNTDTEVGDAVIKKKL